MYSKQIKFIKDQPNIIMNCNGMMENWINVLMIRN